MPDSLYTVVEALWRASWQGGVALLAVLLLTRCWRQMPARLRVWLWRLAYLKLLLALCWGGTLTVPAPMYLPTQLPALAWSLALEAPGHGSVAGTITPAPAASSSDVRARTADAHHAAADERRRALPATVLPDGITCLLLLWLLGVAWGGYSLALIWRQTMRLRRGCRPVADECVLALLTELARAANVRQVPVVLASAGEGPLLLGVLHPAIIIPAELLATDNPIALRLILAHELAHIRRHDIAWGWVAALTECLFFFHPLVRVGNREWELAREMACDALAVRTTALSRAAYGAMLTEAAAYCAGHARPTLLAVGVSESFFTLERRLRAMKERTRFSRRHLAVLGALLLLLLALLLIPWRMAKSQAQLPQVRWSLQSMEVSPDGKHVAVAFFGEPTTVISYDGTPLRCVPDYQPAALFPCGPGCVTVHR